MFIGEASVPPDTTIYAIGDIHGLHAQLHRAMIRIEADIKSKQPKHYRIVFTGDYTDRGPHSKEVIKRLIKVRDDHGDAAVFIKGNHDKMMLDALAGHRVDHWLDNGGWETLDSYGVDTKDFRSWHDVIAEARVLIPSEHTQFLGATELYRKIGDYLFVHAGIAPEFELEQQTEHAMLWIRRPFLDFEGDFGFVVVHGHTPEGGFPIKNSGNRINIDNGAVFYNHELIVLKLRGKTWDWA